MTHCTREQVACGGRHTAAVTPDGVYCWGAISIPHQQRVKRPAPAPTPDSDVSDGAQHDAAVGASNVATSCDSDGCFHTPVKVACDQAWRCFDTARGTPSRCAHLRVDSDSGAGEGAGAGGGGGGGGVEARGCHATGSQLATVACGRLHCVVLLPVASGRADHHDAGAGGAVRNKGTGTGSSAPTVS